MNKPRLFILSDIFGSSEEDWMKEYKQRLSPLFEITQFDCRELAGIHALPQSEVHGAFVAGGINLATQGLLEKHAKPDVILGFSVGGTIAWKYALLNADVSLYLVSATRIRNEEIKPNSTMRLYFGEREEHGPKQTWFEKMNLIPATIQNDLHECYKSPNVIERVCQDIKSDFFPSLK
jgi:hypothetical protein